MRILGIDPGLASTGWGLIETEGSRLRHLGHGVINTESGLLHGKRLALIYGELVAIIKKHRPEKAAIETLFFSRNVTSALAVSEARGVVLLALEQEGLTVFEARPNDIKKAVAGTGKAEKHQVSEMVKLLLALPSIPKPDHAADALGAAICASQEPAF